MTGSNKPASGINFLSYDFNDLMFIIPSTMISEKEKNIIIDTLSPYKPKSIGIFGSRSRNEYNDSSDLDLLVDLEDINLLELVNLESELSSLLGIKVDLITKSSLSKHLRPLIEHEIRYIMNKGAGQADEI